LAQASGVCISTTVTRPAMAMSYLFVSPFLIGWPVLLLSLCQHASVGLAADCGPYRGESAADLRINHAQVLGSHNSYHIGNSIWNYTHPPLDVQLSLGIRAFELDVYYDLTTKDIRVLHIVGADEGSTCGKLEDCLALVKTWSNANPWHFPLFFQIEFLGGISPAAAQCTYSDVEAVTACAVTKCVGKVVPEMNDCMKSLCPVEAIGAIVKQSACTALPPCLESEQAKYPPTTVITANLTTTTVRACTVAVQSSEEKVTIEAADMPPVAQKIISILDASFPSTHRIAPKDLFTDGFTEAAALQAYTPSGSGNFWPTVDASRGKALFWLGGAAWLEPYMPNATRPVFLNGVDISIIKKDDPTRGAKPLVEAGHLVRTVSDTQGEMLSISRRSAALDSGAGVISTDLFPTSCSSHHDCWVPHIMIVDDSAHVWIPGGLPVRCNPVSAAAITDCTSLLLEDPSAVSCGTSTTSTTMQTTMTTTIAMATATLAQASTSSSHATIAFATMAFAGLLQWVVFP